MIYLPGSEKDGLLDFSEIPLGGANNVVGPWDPAD